MSSKQKTLLLIIVVGGLAVVGSYLYAFLAYPHALQNLWGDVPASVIPFYGIGMALGAAGFFAYSFYLVFKLDPDQARVFKNSGYSIFNSIMLCILLSSALWTPLALGRLTEPYRILWALVRADLFLTGLASLALVIGLLTLKPRPNDWAYRLAVTGAVFFALHTLILDAFVWPSYFPV